MTKKAILCVDDEKTILDSIRGQLKYKFGNQYNYEFAESAYEAWEIILDLEEDGVNLLLIVSDWLMPGIKGDEFLVKVHERFPKVIKVMLTGQADPENIENAMKNANLYKCLSKPWQQEELYEMIEYSMSL
ncbi:MAG: response regulator [Leptospiraceae bacterium]|nr:response regulator [Leptospiraceae bacterium]MCK6380535.1 response regulator [Leptospiraceae bacterium]NUM42414.1 response regulator [Leptospiraceae bacterium]